MGSSKAKTETLLGCYRILEIADEKGEYCGKRLADMGADVIKIENPSGSKTRSKGPFFHEQTGLETSLNFMYFNTNKHSITLDLEHRDGQEIFKKLVKTADAVVESMPVGYLASLGLDYESLSLVNPSLVMTSISPFGQTGSYKNLKSTDIVNMAMGGSMQVCGDPGVMPLRCGGEQSFNMGAQCAALGTITALYSRYIIGKGQHVDISLQECVLTYGHELAIPQNWEFHKKNVVRSGAILKNTFPYGIFPCKDGYAVVCTVQAPEWDRLAEWIHEVTGCTEILDNMFKGTVFDRGPYVDILMVYLLDFTKRLTKNELVIEGQRRRIPIMPVQTIEDIMNCPQLNGWGFFEQVNHSVTGELKYPGNPGHFSEGNLEKWQAAPLLGEHNEQIYSSELGLTMNDLAVLRSNGVI
ncbi:MAG: CaiB/BaiF CoA transferase family protein [Smithellaceae bacterium]